MKVYSIRKIGKILGVSHEGARKILYRSGLNYDLPLSENELKNLKNYYTNYKHSKKNK